MLKYKKPWVPAHEPEAAAEEEKKGEEGSEFGGAGIYLPCVPNLDHTVEFKTAAESETAERHVEHSYLRKVLIKCKEAAADNTGDIVGFASGKRSAILFDPESRQLIRLKGCGNLDVGFPLEPMEFPIDSHEIRGC